MDKTCPRCGEEKVYETYLHICPQGGVPMRCSRCYHTWCNDKPNELLQKR